MARSGRYADRLALRSSVPDRRHELWRASSFGSRRRDWPQAREKLDAAGVDLITCKPFLQRRLGLTLQGCVDGRVDGVILAVNRSRAQHRAAKKGSGRLIPMHHDLADALSVLRQASTEWGRGTSFDQNEAAR